MDHEENLSDASLIEDDDDEMDEEMEEIERPMEEESESSIIDLPGMPVMSEAPAATQDTDSEQEFYGFTEEDVVEKDILDPKILEASNHLDLSHPFPSDMEHCSGWYDGQLPFYRVTFRDVSPMITDQERKVKPIKIKKPLPLVPQVTAPAVLLPIQRESREWKPSSQFFKPLTAGWVREVIFDRTDDGSYQAKAKEVIYHAPVMPGTKPRTFKSQSDLRPYLSNSATLTLHNFSFRNDRLNAPKVQEICRAVDEVVEIFPPKPVVLPAAAVLDTPKKPIKEITTATSLSPSLPSGVLKVKMFGKMKERNAFDSPTSTSSEVRNSSADESMNADDEEDFELEAKQPQPQSLGNSGVTITPISKIKRKEPHLGIGVNIHMPSSSLDLTKKMKMSTTPSSKKRPILRPPQPGPVTCSIHCPNTTGFPQLSCASCQSLYHPTCVGLGPHQTDYSVYDFYCASCTPPAGKENKPFTLGNGGTTITAASASLGSVAKTKALPSVTLTPTGTTAGATKKRPPGRLFGAKGATPLRPIEAQSVVNIAGMKYLVVPHPDPGSVTKSNKKDGKSSGAAATKLPIVLKPQQGASESCPCFEVEENSDGKLTLVPMGSGSVRNPFKKSSTTNLSTHFQTTLSAGYFAMLNVFKYLSTRDRLAASKVCKLWYQISKHHSLWTQVNLKSCRIHNWVNLRDQLNRNGTHKLDLRRLLFAKTEEATWQDFSQDLISAAITLKSLDLPKISSASLHSIVQAAKDSPITRLSTLNAASISFTDDQLEPIDLVHIGQLEPLQELKLKSASGSLQIDDFDISLSQFVNLKADTLTKLSLLSLKSLTGNHLTSIGNLKCLNHLELGNCDKIQAGQLFPSLVKHTQLRYLRLECGSVDANLGDLSQIPTLRELELIDFEMVQGFGDGMIMLQNIKKLLLIPVYKNEVAATNAEAVDALLSLSNLSHFFLGLTTEWLDSMNALMSKDSSNSKDSFPILVNNVVEMYTLSRLFKTVQNAMPMAKRVKILKMPKSATKKQYIANQK